VWKEEGVRSDISNEAEVEEVTEGRATNEYQIKPRSKKEPKIEIREPNEETIFHFKKVSG